MDPRRPQLPCVGAEKILLPRLGTHPMVQSALGSVEHNFTAAHVLAALPVVPAPAKVVGTRATAAALALCSLAHAQLSQDGAV